MIRSGHRPIDPRRLVYAALTTLIVSSAILALLTHVIPLTGRSTLVVAGPSMAPALQVGSLLIVERIDPSSLAVGDIVSLKSGPARAIFTHRIVRLVERGGSLWLETKGDANATADPAILPASDVIGRVGWAVPYLGYVVTVISSPSGLLLVVIPGLLLLVASWILDQGAAPRRAPASA